MPFTDRPEIVHARQRWMERAKRKLENAGYGPAITDPILREGYWANRAEAKASVDTFLAGHKLVQLVHGNPDIDVTSPAFREALSELGAGVGAMWACIQGHADPDIEAPEDPVASLPSPL